MTLLTLGLSHKTAPIDEREQWVFLPEQMPDLLSELQSQQWVDETAIVSTCNRVEFYLKVNRLKTDHLLGWWSDIRRGSVRQLKALTYEFSDEVAVKHLLRVASGLDSMVVGEPQILGQIKEAYQQAEQQGTLGRNLRHLFDFGFRVAKQVRTETDIGVNPVSVASTSVLLAKRIFNHLSEKKALLVGAGETIELVAMHFKSAGVCQMKVVNRTLERAQRLADKVGGEALVLEDLANQLPDADIVVSCTGSPVPIVGKGIVEKAMKQRKYESMFVIDLAVPRDVEPAVDEIANVFVYTVDDLQSVISDHKAQRLSAAEAAETLVAHKASEYRHAVQTWQASEVVRAYRDSLEALAQSEIAKATKALEQGRSPEEVLKRYGHDLINKIMHAPTVEMRKLAERGHVDALANARQLLLGHSDTLDDRSDQ